MEVFDLHRRLIILKDAIQDRELLLANRLLSQTITISDTKLNYVTVVLKIGLVIVHVVVQLAKRLFRTMQI